MNNQEYQKAELQRFHAEQSVQGFFGSVKEWVDWCGETTPEYWQEQIEWIENGCFGAGACLAFQKVMRGITPRCNAVARIGQFALSVFYGKPFTGWRKLPVSLQDAITEGVKSWMEQERDWAIILEV